MNVKQAAHSNGGGIIKIKVDHNFVRCDEKSQLVHECVFPSPQVKTTASLDR